MNFHRDAFQERDKLCRQLDQLLQKLAGFPEGDLSCRVNHNRFKYFHIKKVNGAKPVYEYIPHSQASLAATLALKKYYSCKAEDARQEIRALSHYLQCVERNCHHTQDLLGKKGMSDLIRPQIVPDNEPVRQWLTQDYPKNPDYPENLKIPTLGGFMVRSKSEALIADMLIERSIPVRYECQLILGRNVYFPDFTIMHPKTGEIVIWEHFGMMSSSVYQAEYASKINKYIVNGYIPYRNLITTFETAENPFDISAADRIVKMMF